MNTTTIDLLHLGLRGAIACYLTGGEEPALVDPGPTTTLGRLEEALSERGLLWDDIRRVFLTHVHLDHAGATGHILERTPHVEVVVHEEGAPHMADPERLVRSTRRTFGEKHDRLWGEVLPVPADRIRAVRGGEAVGGGLRPVPTPGHTGHHLAYLAEDEGILFTGDALGIVLSPDAPTHPATPPPGVDLEAWFETLAVIRGLAPERAAVTHFGIHEDAVGRARALEEALRELAGRVEAARRAEDAGAAERFEAEVRERLAGAVGELRVHEYFDRFSAAMDWAGVEFYLSRR